MDHNEAMTQLGRYACILRAYLKVEKKSIRADAKINNILYGVASAPHLCYSTILTITHFVKPVKRYQASVVYMKLGNIKSLISKGYIYIFNTILLW